MATTDKIQGEQEDLKSGPKDPMGTKTMGDVSGDGWRPTDEGTSSPPHVATGSSTYSGTAYDDMGASGSTFTKENLEPPVSSPPNLSSIEGGKSRSEKPAEGWSENVAQLKDRAQDVAGQLANQAQDLAGQLKGQAQELAARAQDFAADAVDRAGEAAGQAVRSASDSVRRYPVQSLLVGFGLGCLVGMLLPNRR